MKKIGRFFVPGFLSEDLRREQEARSYEGERGRRINFRIKDSYHGEGDGGFIKLKLWRKESE